MKRNRIIEALSILVVVFTAFAFTPKNQVTVLFCDHATNTCELVPEVFNLGGIKVIEVTTNLSFTNLPCTGRCDSNFSIMLSPEGEL